MTDAPKLTVYTVREPESATKFASVDYPKFRKLLTEQGWREQERKWYDDRESSQRHTHHIEWWNRGRESLLVYVLDQTAHVYQPLTMRRLMTAVMRKEDGK